MFKISLVNMPFSLMGIPSIGLTQLKSVTEQQFGDRVRVRILYLNLKFIDYLGQSLYTTLMYDADALGEWLFRSTAFPEAPDNAQEYFQRFHSSSEKAPLKGKVLAKRMGLKRFMLQLVDEFGLDREDLVGFTSVFYQNVASIAMSRVIKDRNPSTVTVMGGSNCEAPMGGQLARQVDSLDAVLSGPGLVSFPRLVHHLMEGKSECDGIRGVHTRRNAGSAHLKGHGAMGEELPIDVPVPLDYDAFLDDLRKKVSVRIEPRLQFQTSRGCWWGERAHCTFCGLNGSTMAYKAMPPQMALQQFDELLKRYSDRCRHFDSVDNIMPREYLTEVFPHLKPPPGVTFFYEVKADLSDANIQTLSKAGMTELQPGIESLSTSTLKLMKKGTTAFRNLAFLKSAIRHGVRPIWNLLIAFPGEEEDVYRKYLRDIPLLTHLPPPNGCIRVRFDRYSPYHMKAEEYGLDLTPFEFYEYVYPFSPEALMGMAYFFDDRKRSAEYLARIVSWQKRVDAQLAPWIEAWKSKDRSLRASLRFEERGTDVVIIDTRSGAPLEHRPSQKGLMVLNFLDSRGRRLKDIAQHLGLSGAALGEEIDDLHQKGLLFEENGRLMSLVIGESEVPVGSGLALGIHASGSEGLEGASIN